HAGGYQLGLAGGAALTLRSAGDHPLYPLGLAITAVDAASRGNLDLAERRSVAALAADRRLHAEPAPDVEILVREARADCALALADFSEAARLSRETSRIA